MTTTTGQDKKRRRRIGAALTLTAAGTLGLLALSGPAFAGGGSLSNINLAPGQEACTAAYASSSVYASGSANSPGLKFKIIAQSGVTVPGTAAGPVTSWAAQTQNGWYNWQGAGDYTACAKNNGTTNVYLNYVTISTS